VTAIRRDCPAFPFSALSPDGRTVTDAEGLCVRDYVAIKMAAAMISHGTWPDANDRREIAKRAVAMADSLLSELDYPE